MIDRYLSIWEISHRWHDLSPDKSEPFDLPLNVQDAIRFICRGALDGYLGLYELVVMKSEGAINRAGACTNVKQFPLEKFPAAIEESLYRKYDKGALDSCFIDGDNLLSYCFRLECDFPAFWFDLIIKPYLVKGVPPDNSTQQVTPSRPCQLDKIICQRIGAAMWKKNPLLMIKEIALSDEIQNLCGASKYELEAVQGWISEVDPRNPATKRGRKRKDNSATEKTT